MAFKNCEKFKEFSIPGTVKFLGSRVFAGLSLNYVNIEDAPDNLKISAECFGDVTQIKSLHLGRNVFYSELDSKVSMLGISHIENFTMSPDLTTIHSYFFSGLTESNWPGIVSCKMPWKVEELDNGCFYECTGLKETLLPPSVKKIGQNAFSGSSLRKLSVMSPEPPQCGAYPFDSEHYAKVELIVPTESVDLYRSQAPWSNFANISGSDFTSVEGVTVTDDMPVEWYDMNGRKVSGENMPAGIYLRRQGSKVEKTIIH